MKKVIKLKESDIHRMVRKVMGEAKKTKKENDSPYDSWCKENGYEHGVGIGCADAALDSKESTIRSWGLGYLMGSKINTLKEETDPYANKRYDAESDEWVGKNDEDKYLSGPHDKEYIEGIINGDRHNKLVGYLQSLISSEGFTVAEIWKAIKHGLTPQIKVNDRYVMGEPDVEYGDEEDERRYDDRENYGTDDESRYDERNYKYGNHPDDDYED